MMLDLAFGMPGNTEWIIILVIGLIIFGKRLPEVGRSLGRSIVEFKKGIKGIEDEIEQSSSTPSASTAGGTTSGSGGSGATDYESQPPLQPYDRRLGGNEDELRDLQDQGDADARREREESAVPRDSASPPPPAAPGNG